jgi:hypothetical protein
MPKIAWEHIADGCDCWPVPGGWIYRIDGQLIYVPDPDYHYRKEGERAEREAERAEEGRRRLRKELDS